MSNKKNGEELAKILNQGKDLKRKQTALSSLNDIEKQIVYEVVNDPTMSVAQAVSKVLPHLCVDEVVAISLALEENTDIKVAIEELQHVAGINRNFILSKALQLLEEGDPKTQMKALEFLANLVLPKESNTKQVKNDREGTVAEGSTNKISEGANIFLSSLEGEVLK